MRCHAIAAFALLLWAAPAFAAGKLQIHHMNVGQGDGAVMITPSGKVVLFDAGEDTVHKNCTLPISYLDQLGVAQIDALFVSHYHSDHIGCVPAVLAQFPLKGNAYDRGAKYHTGTYDAYETAIGGHRKTLKVGDTVTFDGGAVAVRAFAVNAQSQNGAIETTNENDLSLAVLVMYGQFREEIGGDLSGENTGDYKDVETPVATDVGHVDVYKVHHHCSTYSTNDAWLSATKPTIGIISTGDGNGFTHPHPKCLQRLRAHHTKKVYWTQKGSGGLPKSGTDIIAGNVIVEIPEGGSSYTVAYGTKVDSYTVVTAGSPPPPAATTTTPKYAWSSKSQVFHLAACSYVSNISPANLQRGDTPPAGKHQHNNCPTGQ